MGRDEALDVEAAVALVPAGVPVVTVGTSLGGAAVLLHAGTFGEVSGVVALSAPAWWTESDREGSAKIRRYVTSPAGRAVLGAFLRTRVSARCQGAVDPADVVGRVAPAFTVLVHDPNDSYFGPEHAEALMARASQPKDLWWYEGGGHGTDLFTPDLADRLVAEIRSRVGPLAAQAPSSPPLAIR